MYKIRVLVSDDIKYMCFFFRELLNNSKNCVCVGEAENEKETMEQVKKLKPDILLLDMQMDMEDSGLILIPKVLEVSPETKIIMISVHDDSENIYKAIQLGAKDYILKEQPPTDIIENIERIYEGKDEIRRDIVDKILKQYDIMEKKQKSILFFINNMFMLTSRELELIIGLGRGLSYEQMAERLKLEDGTIRTYVSRILKKMQYNRMSTLMKDLKEVGVMEFLINKDKNNDKNNKAF